MENMTLTKKLCCFGFISLLFFNSCVQKTYYQSPGVGSLQPYHAMPVASDSVKSATYVNATVGLGAMNQRLRDDVFSFQSGLHRSHVIGNLRMSYGASVAVGSYDVDPYGPFYPDTVSRIKKPGTKFFGAYGGYGAISAAAPMGRRGEWRVLGIEGSLFNEFGNYYTFRQNLPDSAATTIDRKKYLGSLGVTTEFVFKGRSKNKFGMKFTLGSYLRSLDFYDKYSSSYNRHDDLIFFSSVYHATIKKSTAFVQLNFATHATNVQFGFNYRL